MPLLLVATAATAAVPLAQAQSYGPRPAAPELTGPRLDDLANGQEVTSALRFENSVEIEGLTANGLGAAVFDSSPGGPNAWSSDPDLLVDRGNVLILQERPLQNLPGIYDFPDDARAGGDLHFRFLPFGARLASLDLIDICPLPGEGATVSLFDVDDNRARYSIPAGWTEDVSVDGPPGYRTLDLTTSAPQPGFLSTATALVDAAFDPALVTRMAVHLEGSGAVDDLTYLAAEPVFHEIYDGNPFSQDPIYRPRLIELDPFGNIYVLGWEESDLYRIAPDGTVERLLNEYILPHQVDFAVDHEANAYLASKPYGQPGAPFFLTKVAPDGSFSRILDENGDGMGNPFFGPTGLATDPAGNVFASSFANDLVFRVAPTGEIDVVLDGADPGNGATLDGPARMQTDVAGNLYVVGLYSRNVLRVTPGGAVSEIIGPAGDGMGNVLHGVEDLTVDEARNVYVLDAYPHGVFRIDAAGEITWVLDRNANGAHRFWSPNRIHADAYGNVYVSEGIHIGGIQALLVLTPAGEVHVLNDELTSYGGEPFDTPWGMTSDHAGNLYVTGERSRNAWRVERIGALLAGRSKTPTTPPRRRPTLRPATPEQQSQRSRSSFRSAR